MIGTLKPVLVVAAVVVAIQALSLGTRRGGEGGTADLPPVFDTVEALLVDRSPLAFDDVSAPCAAGDGFALAGGTSCAAQIAGSGRPVREGTLRLEVGGVLAVVLTQPSAVTAETALATGESVDLDVFEDPASLDLRCTGAATCVVSLS